MAIMFSGDCLVIGSISAGLSSHTSIRKTKLVILSFKDYHWLSKSAILNDSITRYFSTPACSKTSVNNYQPNSFSMFVLNFGGVNQYNQDLKSKRAIIQMKKMVITQVPSINA